MKITIALALLIAIIVIGQLPRVNSQISVEPDRTPTFNAMYPTNEFEIQSQDYFGYLLEYSFDCIEGFNDKRNKWNVTWNVNQEYEELWNRMVRFSGSGYPQPDLLEIYNKTEALQAKDFATFSNDIKRLNHYTIDCDTGLTANIPAIDFHRGLNYPTTGSFEITFDEEWQPNKAIRIGFGTTITYSVATDSITIDGGTELAPVTFYDIWLEDLKNNWNQTSMTCENSTKGIGHQSMQFLFDCKLIVGNNTDPTWLMDADVQVSFTNLGTRYVTLKKWSHFIMGNCYYEGTVIKGTDQGVTFLFNETTASSDIFATSSTSHSVYIDLRFYGCTIMNLANKSLDIQYCYGSKPYGERSRYYNCFFSDIRFYRSYYFYMYGCYLDDVIFYRSGAHYDSYYGIYYMRDNVMVTSLTEVFHEFTSSGVKCMDLKVYSTGAYLIYRNWGVLGDSYLVNVDSNNWAFRSIPGLINDYVFRQYTFDLQVLFANGTAVNASTVEVKRYGVVPATEFTETTNSSGQIDTQTLTMGRWTRATGATFQDNNPFSLNVTLDGYTPYFHNFTLDRKEDWVIYLEPAVESDYIVSRFDFNYSAPEPLAVIQFNGTYSRSNNAITDYSWTFGDGNTSAIAEPTHYYNVYGNYTVTLNVTSLSGFNVFSQNITCRGCFEDGIGWAIGIIIGAFILCIVVVLLLVSSTKKK